MPNSANGAFGSDLFNKSIPISGTQSNTDERTLPTPKNMEKSLSSGIPVSEHDKMMQVINEGAKTNTAPTPAPEPPTHEVIHWKDLPKRADQALFLAQQGKPVNQIARLTGWSEGSVKTTFSTWKKKKLVTGRAAKIEPQLHEDRMPDFRILFLERGMNKSQIVEQYDYHPNVVEDAFYRLKRERLLSGSAQQPIVIGKRVVPEPKREQPPTPLKTATLEEARPIITACFLDKGMKNDGIAAKYPEMKYFIPTVFQELIASGQLLGTPGKPILKTEIPDPVYRLPTEPTAPPLREKDVVKPEKPKLGVEPPSTHQDPPSSTKLNKGYIEPKPLPERDLLPPQVRQWMDEAERGMKEGTPITIQPNTDVSFDSPNGTTVLVEPENEVDPTSEETKRAAVDALVTSEQHQENSEGREGTDKHEKSKAIVRSCFLDKGMNSIEIAQAYPDLTPYIHTVYSEMRHTTGHKNHEPLPLIKPSAIRAKYRHRIEGARRNIRVVDSSSGKTIGPVQGLLHDDSYVQNLQRELQEAKRKSHEAEKLREELAELREKFDSVASAPPPPFKNGMTNEGPTLVIPSDTKIEYEDDGTFLHLTRMTECEEPPDVAPDPIEVGRLQLNNEELCIETLRGRFDLLIQSLTMCGAERFDIDLSLKGWKL